jgi:hypothetical protein
MLPGTRLSLIRGRGGSGHRTTSSFNFFIRRTSGLRGVSLAVTARILLRIDGAIKTGMERVRKIISTR